MSNNSPRLDALTAEWRVSDTSFLNEDGDEYKTIVWEDETPDANIWEVGTGFTEAEAAHIVALHNAFLSPPERERYQWQDIGTAPQDGTELIGRFGPKKFALVWYFAPSSQVFGWCDVKGDRVYPKQWMHIPPPPEPQDAP